MTPQVHPCGFLYESAVTCQQISSKQLYFHTIGFQTLVPSLQSHAVTHTGKIPW